MNECLSQNSLCTSASNKCAFFNRCLKCIQAVVAVAVVATAVVVVVVAVVAVCLCMFAHLLYASIANNMWQRHYVLEFCIYLLFVHLLTHILWDTLLSGGISMKLIITR